MEYVSVSGLPPRWSGSTHATPLATTVLTADSSGTVSVVSKHTGGSSTSVTTIVNARVDVREPNAGLWSRTSATAVNVGVVSWSSWPPASTRMTPSRSRIQNDVSRPGVDDSRM